MDSLLIQLYTMYRNYMLKVAHNILNDPEDSADVVQDAFVKLWVCRQDLRHTGELKQLMCIMVRRLSRDCLSRRRYRESYARQSGYGVTVSKSSDFGPWALKYIHSERSRQIMELLYIKGLEAPEVAEHLGIKEQTVRNVNCESVKQLRKIALKY